MFKSSGERFIEKTLAFNSGFLKGYKEAIERKERLRRDELRARELAIIEKMNGGAQ